MSNKGKSKQTKKTPVAEPAVAGEQQLGTDVQTAAQPQGEAVVNNVGEELKLTQCEGVIEQNIGGFMLVGQALKAIDEEKLYRAKFKTFQDYCRQRWGLSDKYAYRQIKAYTCVDQLKKELSPEGVTRFPTNESQVRPLVSLESTKWAKAWQKVLKACKDGSITAEDVEKVVHGMVKRPTSSQIQPQIESPMAGHNLEKIEKLVTETLEVDDSKLTVPKLKKVLEKIQKLLVFEK